MKVSAVICEYNPFHLGHAYQLRAAASPAGEKENAVIAIMSGSFTQRGEPAVLSKYQRAEIAVRLGADLVLELPFPPQARRSLAVRAFRSRIASAV